MAAIIEGDRMETLKTGAVRQSNQEGPANGQQGASGSFPAYSGVRTAEGTLVLVGIDPGLSGALFGWGLPGETGEWTCVQDTPTIEVGRTTGTKREHFAPGMAKELQKWKSWGYEVRAVVEQPIPMPKQASQSTLAMGIGFGLWQGICAALEIPLRVVHPATWKADLFSGSGLYRPPVRKDAPTAEKARQQSQRKRVLKNNSRVLAARLFPQLADYFARVKDDGRAESALLAYWLRCELEGKWLRCKPRQRPEKADTPQDS